jgi:hypothetical protein
VHGDVSCRRPAPSAGVNFPGPAASADVPVSGSLAINKRSMEPGPRLADMTAAALVGAPLRTQLLEEALANAVARQGSPEAGAPEVHIRRHMVSFADACLASPALCLLCTAVAALSMLLVLRPPFVLHFEYDARRPWKGSMRLSWFAVFLAVLCVVAIGAGLPIVCDMAGRTAGLGFLW